MNIIQDVTCLVTSCTSEDGLKTAEKLLLTLKNKLTISAAKATFPTVNNSIEPANKGIKKQRLFKAVKSKHKCNIRFSNPSLHESNGIKSVLFSTQSNHQLYQAPQATNVLQYNTLGTYVCTLCCK